MASLLCQARWHSHDDFTDIKTALQHADGQFKLPKQVETANRQA
jgi:hypothetical protein